MYQYACDVFLVYNIYSLRNVCFTALLEAGKLQKVNL